MNSRDLDNALRNRLTEMFASAGVDSSRASLELLWLLPGEFLSAYAEMFDKALKLDGGRGGGSDAGEVGKKPAGRSQDKGKKVMLGSGGKRYKNHWIVRDDGTLNLKHRLDKRLRAMGREIRSELAGSESSASVRHRCGRCGRIMAEDWSFCPSCGNHKGV